MNRRSLAALLAALLLLLSGCAGAAPAQPGDEHYIVTAVERGLLEPMSDGSTGLGKPVTRGQFSAGLSHILGTPAEDGDGALTRIDMALMLTQALDLTELAGALRGSGETLPDVTADAGAAAMVCGMGLMTPISSDDGPQFLPGKAVTREQAARALVLCQDRTQRQELAWLHGFYAFDSYGQLSYAGKMDHVSVGWARLEVDQAGAWVNSTTQNGNDWARPTQYRLAAGFFEQNAIPYNLNVYADAATLDALLDAGAQEQAASALADAAGPYAGLTLDFEGLRQRHRQPYAQLVALLREKLGDYKCLYVCVQPDTWFEGFDYRALGEVCDKVILMAHDYHWASIPDYYLGTDNTYCPVTPILQIYTALAHITDPETGVADLDKVALQISFGTAGFHVDADGFLLDTQLYHPATATIAKRLGQSDSQCVWDTYSQNPCLSYTTDDGQHYKLWFEDQRSIAAKLRLARLFGVNSVSVWRLGSIPDYDDIPNYNVWRVLTAPQ